MRTEIIKIDPARPETVFSRCREVIRSGGVIVYPTDTFYGLGADPRNPVAVKKLFEIKGRQTNQPILLLIGKIEEVRNWAEEITPCADDLMKRFWPGPLTLVFKAHAGVAPELTAGTDAIGLRVPGTELTRELLGYLSSALTGTSANRSGGPEPRTAEEAAVSVGAMVDLIIDGGKAPGEKPSTVVDVRTTRPLVLREGAVPSQEITG